MAPGTTINDDNFHAAVQDWFLNGDLSSYGDITKWCTGLVTNMRSAFEGRDFNEDISAWDVSNVTNMSYMFSNSSFNIDIGRWDVSSVTNMEFILLMKSSQLSSSLALQNTMMQFRSKCEIITHESSPERSRELNLLKIRQWISVASKF